MYHHKLNSRGVSRGSVESFSATRMRGAVETAAGRVVRREVTKEGGGGKVI